MKELVIVSGKGGTGKTSLAASFAVMAGGDAVLADCDVDASDLHLLLNPIARHSEKVFSGYIPDIDVGRCIRCGECADHCVFHAVSLLEGLLQIDELICAGCGFCARICPWNAVTMTERKIGECLESEYGTDGKLFHAELQPGAQNSGKLVALLREKARSAAEECGASWVLVDGPPGIGCPSVSAISGADFVLVVTEPSMTALQDLKRVRELAGHFSVPVGIVLNKSGLNDVVMQEMKTYITDEKILLVGEIPFSRLFMEALAACKPLPLYAEYGEEPSSGNVMKCVQGTWERICEVI